MSMKKMAAALTAAAVVLGIGVINAVGNMPVMADEIISQATSDTSSDTAESDVSSGEDSTGSEETPDEAAYTLTSVDATVKSEGGGTFPSRGVDLGGDGSTITITVSNPYSTTPTGAIVSLTGVAAATVGTETVELTAEPVTVEFGNTSGTDYTLKSADGSVSLSGKVVVILKERPKYTLSNVSAVVTDALGVEVSSDVTEVGSDYITITVPYNTADGSVTVKLAAGTMTIESEDGIQTVADLTADPVTVEIDNDRGATFTLKNVGNTASFSGKVFVKKAEAPSTSEPDTSEPDTSEPDTSEPDTSEPSSSEPSTSTPSTSTPSTSTPAASENEFKPTLPTAGLDKETERVLGGITVTNANGAFDIGVVMNVKPGQTTNGFSFDITFTKNGSEVQPKGSVTVKVPVPEALKGKTVYVFHIENGKLVLVSSEVKDGFVIFSADHFSEYVLSAENLADTGYTENSDSTSVPESKPTAPVTENPNTGVAAAAVPVLLAAGASVVVIAKKKK